MAPSVGRRRVWLTPTTRVPCSNAAKMRNRLKLAGVPQTRQRISAVSGPKFAVLWGHVEEILIQVFFPIVNTCLSCKDMSRQSCAMASRWRIFGDFFVLHFHRAVCSTFQTWILNLHYGHTVCGSVVDIQSATAEIRRGKKIEEETTGQKYNVGICYAGRP